MNSTAGFITKILQPPINYIIIAVIIGIIDNQTNFKKQKKALAEQVETELKINDYDESQLNEKTEQLPKDTEYGESKDSTQGTKFTEKLGEDKPKHDIDALLDDLKRDAKKSKMDDI